MYKNIRRSLALLVLSMLCLSQVGCTTGGGFEITRATPLYYNYNSPYYNINPGYYGYYFGSPSPYYYNNEDYYDGYYGGYYYR